MVNPKELRIGNYVHKIDAVVRDGIIQYSKRLYEISHNDIYHIVEDGDPTNQPIPLTPEWLAKCGFNKLNAGWINSSGSMCFYDRARDINGYYTMDYGTRNYVARFKYLHQLQNLYFALTGEELTIKQ